MDKPCREDRDETPPSLEISSVSPSGGRNDTGSGIPGYAYSYGGSCLSYHPAGL
jgi:hypothetical protein